MTEFYKENETDIVYWVLHNPVQIGCMEITIDKKHVYNLYRDCEIIPDDIWKQFVKENPFWGEYFKNRRKNVKN